MSQENKKSGRRQTVQEILVEVEVIHNEAQRRG
jgi:hypothetical protein